MLRVEVQSGGAVWGGLGAEGDAGQRGAARGGLWDHERCCMEKNLGLQGAWHGEGVRGRSGAACRGAVGCGMQGRGRPHGAGHGAGSGSGGLRAWRREGAEGLRDVGVLPGCLQRDEGCGAEGCSTGGTLVLLSCPDPTPPPLRPRAVLQRLLQQRARPPADPLAAGGGFPPPLRPAASRHREVRGLQGLGMGREDGDIGVGGHPSHPHPPPGAGTWRS